ncbi:MAG: hypothetical protein PHQ14_13510 [Chromatiales bacterium]|nr:hypothetical protein [Chromatiales bacterium]
MRQLLTRSRSIVGATLWGAAVAIVTFVGLLVGDFVLSLHRDHFGPAAQIDAIAVGGGYAISLDATPAHPFLAEYRQSIGVYGSDTSGDSLLGRVEIPTNTGGRVRIGVLVPTEIGRAEVVLADRHAVTGIDLSSRITMALDSWRQPTLMPLGIISGESHPIRFIPCAVWPRLPVEERQAIIDAEDDLQGFCEMTAQDAATTGVAER